MRIAIDGRALTGRFTGDRTYWKGLLRALPQPVDDMEFLVYSRAPIPPSELPDAPNVTARVVESASDRTWTALALPAALRRDQADLVHVQYTAPPRTLCPCPIVTTVHDISFKLFPEWFQPKDRFLLNLTVPASMRRAARVITDSESSRHDIIAAYKLPPEQIEAIPLGLPDGFGVTDNGDRDQQALARYHIDGPYVLAVGVLQPRKNLLMLCEAFGRAKSTGSLAQRLVIAGKAGWQTEQDALRSAARRGGGDGAAGSISFIGYVEDADLPALYRRADLFAYPSLYEGFGLPPLEAMACGAPVIVSDSPAVGEVVEDVARIVPARNVAAWAEALVELLTDPEARKGLAEAGPVRASRFSWAVTAERTRAVYRSCVAGSRSRHAASRPGSQ